MTPVHGCDKYQKKQGVGEMKNKNHGNDLFYRFDLSYNDIVTNHCPLTQ